MFAVSLMPLRCTQVEVTEWTSVIWNKKKDGPHGIKFAHDPIFTKTLKIKSFVIRPDKGVHSATST